MSDMDYKELDEDAPEFEKKGLKREERPDEESEPDLDEPWAKTPRGDADEP